MRLRNTHKLRERRFNRGRRIINNRFRPDDMRRGPGFVDLHWRQFIATTLHHAAALRGVPGRGVSQSVGQARLGGQYTYAHNQKRHSGEDNVRQCLRLGASPPGCVSSISKQVEYPC